MINSASKLDMPVINPIIPMIVNTKKTAFISFCVILESSSSNPLLSVKLPDKIMHISTIQPIPNNPPVNKNNIPFPTFPT